MDMNDLISQRLAVIEADVKEIKHHIGWLPWIIILIVANAFLFIK